MSSAAVRIRVDAPVAQKGGKLEMTHYEYPITWTLADGRELRFNRRYSDFEALRTQLANKYWYCVIPPIPGKESLTQNVTAKVLPMVTSHVDPSSSTTSTLTYRQNYLRRFMRRLASHPELSRDALVTESFVDSAAWERALKNPVPPPVFLTTSLVGNLKAMMNAATASKSGKNNEAFDLEEAGVAYTAAMEAARQGHPEQIEYNKTVFFVSHLAKTLGRLETEMLKLTERRAAESEALLEFGSAFRQLSLDESDVALRQSIDLVGAQSQVVAGIRTQHANAEMALVSALGFLVGTCEALQDSLERMVTAHEYRRQLDEKVKAIDAQFNKGVPPANQESLRHERDNTSAKLEEQSQLLAAALPKFAADCVDFHQTRQRDMQELIREIGKVEIEAAEAVPTELRKLDATPKAA